MKSNLFAFPDQNIFPRKKWSAYVNKIALLSNLRATRREISHSIALVERDVDALRSELVEALENGAAIENSGRIAG